MQNLQSDHILRQMVQRLVQRFDPEQIILFGSRARGQARSNSDYDLLVVMPLSGSRRAQRVAMRVALHDFNVPKDVIVVTPEEVARQRGIVGTIVHPAVREGKVLYVRDR